MSDTVEKYCPICHNKMIFCKILGFVEPRWNCFRCEYFEDYQDYYEQISDDRKTS